MPIIFIFVFVSFSQIPLTGNSFLDRILYVHYLGLLMLLISGTH